jgi:8-oxo-dGTP diphosphatase
MRVTVDIVIFTIKDGELAVLLVRRGIAPYKGKWAIPGGFVHEDESIDRAARRELREETGVADVYLEQLASFGELHRDPRGRVVTIAYYALVSSERIALAAGTDAADAEWWPAAQLPPLAFDHPKILGCAIDRLRADLDRANVGFALLPEKFTLGDLQHVHEAVLGESLDKRNFRRRVAQLELVKPVREWRESGRRPAQLYRFTRSRA